MQTYGRRRKRLQIPVLVVDSDEDIDTPVFSSENALLGPHLSASLVSPPPVLLSSPSFQKLSPKRLTEVSVADLTAEDAFTTSPKRFTRLLVKLDEREVPTSPTRKKRAVSTALNGVPETPQTPHKEALDSTKASLTPLLQREGWTGALTGLSTSPRAKATPKEESAWLELLDDLEPTETPTIAFSERFEQLENPNLPVNLTQICRSLEAYLESKVEKLPFSRDKSDPEDSPAAQGLPILVRSYAGDRSFLLERESGDSEDQDHRKAHSEMISALHDYGSSPQDAGNTTDLRTLGRLHAHKDELNYITAGVKFGPPANMAAALADIYNEIGSNLIFSRPGAVRHVLRRLVKAFNRVEPFAHAANSHLCSTQNGPVASPDTEMQISDYRCVLQLACIAMGRLLDVHTRTFNADSCSELLSDSKVIELLEKLGKAPWGSCIPAELLKLARCSVEAVLKSAAQVQPAHIQLLLVRVLSRVQNPSFYRWSAVKVAVEACKHVPEEAPAALALLEAYIAHGLPLEDEGWRKELGHVISGHVTDPTVTRLQQLLCGP